MDHINESLRAYRDAIRKAAGDLPGIKHVPVAGRTVPVHSALEHVVYLLDGIESSLAELDKLGENDRAGARESLNFDFLAAFGMISGILWAQGIDVESLATAPVIDKG